MILYAKLDLPRLINKSRQICNEEYLRMSDYERLKANEYEYQEKKYQATTSLKEKDHITSIAQFENDFLKPIHEGGNKRGYLFSRAIQELPLDQIKGKIVLDYCCGRGDLAVYLAMNGAEVYGFDISENAINIGKSRNRANKLRIQFDVMDAENLQYPDDYFDYIIGFEALHHVIIYPNSSKELARVIKENGKVIFAENYGGNIVFELYRKLVTMRRIKSKVRGEVTLKKSMVYEKFYNYFDLVSITPLTFLYIAKRKVRNRWVLNILFNIDRILLKVMPVLNALCGESVVVLSNKKCTLDRSKQGRRTSQ